MSLAAFQRAMIEITVSPWFARAIRAAAAGDDAVLRGRDLTRRERARLRDVVAQRGISMHCSLARGNRLEMIVQAFPLTCALLQPCLREIVDGLWRERRPTHYQLRDEADAFAHWVGRTIAAGALAIPGLPETLADEVAGRAGPDATPAPATAGFASPAR